MYLLPCLWKKHNFYLYRCQSNPGSGLLLAPQTKRTIISNQIRNLTLFNIHLPNNGFRTPSKHFYWYFDLDSSKNNVVSYMIWVNVQWLPQDMYKRNKMQNNVTNTHIIRGNSKKYICSILGYLYGPFLLLALKTCIHNFTSMNSSLKHTSEFAPIICNLAHYSHYEIIICNLVTKLILHNWLSRIPSNLR